MSYQPWLIANFQHGLSKYLEPWLLPDDAYPTLENAYVYRGVLTKRGGYHLLATLPGGQPVMGLRTRIDSTGTEDFIAFNQNKAFLYNGATSSFDDVSGATSWTGSNSDFFWSENHYGGFFVTNYKDPIRYYLSGNTWTDIVPAVDASNSLENARILVSYKNRLIALSTIENGIEYLNRARWCQNGTPYITNPTPTGVSFDANAWRSDTPGKGGYIDAPTNEAIITCGFIRDTLIVFFEKSTWRLRYTGNELLPFVWDETNSFFGAESQFSNIEFDGGVVAIGSNGIIISNGNETQRVDDQDIPDVVFSIHNENDGQIRVQGIRDFRKELIYWTYPSHEDDPVYPDRVLCYNYRENSWAIFDQSITAFGQFQTHQDLTWESADFAWNETDLAWNSGRKQSGYPIIIAGDKNGNVFFYNERNTDNNAYYNFDIRTKRFSFYAKEGKAARLGYVELYVESTSGGEFTLDYYINNSSKPILTKTVSTDASGDKKWITVYLGGIGHFHQLRFYLSDEQMKNEKIATSNIKIHGLVLYTRPAGRFS